MSLLLEEINAHANAPSPWAGGPFTVSFWVKRRSSTASRTAWVFYETGETQTNAPRVEGKTNSHVVASQAGSTQTCTNSAAITATNWNLYTYVSSGAAGFAGSRTFDLYINGVASGDPITPAYDLVLLTGGPMQLGLVSGGTKTGVGDVAHFAFFESALTPAQIAELLTKVPDEITGASPKVYYPLLADVVNHGSGGATYNLTLSAAATLDDANDSTIPVSPSAPGTPPTGVVTVSDVAPGTTSALVTYSYSAADQTGFEYRVGGGAAASIGASPATISGLTSSTPYSIEVRAINAAGAGSWSAAYGFSTAAAGDTTPPTLTGVVSFSDVTQTSYTMSWPAGSDDTGIAGYEYQIGGTGGAWTDAGADLSEPVSARTPGATETVYVRAYDAAGLRSSPPIAGTVTLLSASTDGTITVGSALYPIKYTSESVLNESGLRATVLDATTLAQVLNTAGVVCSAGVITITDPALVIGTTYHLVVKTAAGWTGFSDEVTAA